MSRAVSLNGAATINPWERSEAMRAQVLFIDGKLRSTLGGLKTRLGLSDDAGVRPWSQMHTLRMPGARTPTDNDLEGEALVHLDQDLTVLPVAHY